MRLPWKLAIGISGVIVTIAVVNAVARIHREAQLFETDIAHDNRVLGRAVARAVERTWTDSGESVARALVDDADVGEADIRVRWVWLDAMAGDPDAPEVPSHLLGAGWQERDARWTVGDDERVYHYVRADVASRPGAVELSESLRAEHAYLGQTIAKTVFYTSLLLVLSVVIVFGIGHVFVGQPVRKLVEHARRIGEGDLDTRLVLTQRDEIGALARELDAMAERLRTSRAQLEQETSARLAMAEQLRHADRLVTVGRLGAGIAHELGTPLNVVIGHAQMIAEESPSPAPAAEHAAIIVSQARRAADIIRQLLDFARRRVPRRAATDLRELSTQTVALLSPLAAKRKARLSVTGEPAIVEIDAAQVQQALTNLIVNALHAMPDPGGTVTIAIERTAATAPDGTPGVACVQLSVTDTGTGIAPEVLARVFEPFFTTKQPGEGTGLGLSVAYGIARDHGGWIDVTSEPARGSRFALVLPEAA